MSWRCHVCSSKITGICRCPKRAHRKLVGIVGKIKRGKKNGQIIEKISVKRELHLSLNLQAAVPGHSNTFPLLNCVVISSFICIREFLVWPVTLTTLAQWQRARELGQPIRGVSGSCMSFLLRSQPAPCFVCLERQGWNLRIFCLHWPGANFGYPPRTPAHEGGRERGRSERRRKGVRLRGQVLDGSLTRHFLPGDRVRLSRASSLILLLLHLLFCILSAATRRPWPWWLCSDPPHRAHPRPARPTAVRGR